MDRHDINDTVTEAVYSRLSGKQKSFTNFAHMAKSVKKEKPKKQRADKYEDKLKIEGTFADVFKVVKKNKEDKKKP